MKVKYDCHDDHNKAVGVDIRHFIFRSAESLAKALSTQQIKIEDADEFWSGVKV